jgi:hypothetical protein
VAVPPFDESSDQRTSLTEWLRGRSDAELADLLYRRPDLALPAPADLPTLASRLGVRTSVQRAVDALDAFLLRVVEAATLSTDARSTTSVDRISALLPALDASALDRAIGELLALGLVWGEPDQLHLAPSVRESLGPYPAALGRPAAQLLRRVPDVRLVPVLRALGLPPAAQPQAGASVAQLLADPARVEELITATTPDERDVLERLAAGPPVGVIRRTPEGAEPSSALALVERGLLIPVDAQTVELPRELGLALRSSPLGPVETTPPAIAVAERAPGELDRLGTTAVLDTLRLVDALAELWTAAPPAQLRSGGIGVREMRRTAKGLGVEETVTVVIAEVAFAAGLVNATHGFEPCYLPTAEYDTWRTHESASRWADLAMAWLAMTRQPSLVNERGDRDRLITLLGPDAERGTTPTLRTQLLDTLAALAPGAAPVGADEVLRRIAWNAPRRAAGQRAVAAAVLAEANLLGITAAGGLTGYSRTLLSGSRAVAEQVLTGALPAPVDHFLVQPDLTVVVPGPPTPDLAAELALSADLESTGGASVYRVTPASVRRALDAGRTGTSIAAMIAQRSRTPVPQALQYLIDDLARRHGALRSGAATAYLRSADEALLARVVADRDVAPLEPRLVAPTVAISQAPVTRVLEVLRAAGYAPAAEDPEGVVIAIGADPARAPSRQPARPARLRTTHPSATHYADLVRRVRSGDTLTTMSNQVAPLAQQVPGVTSAATMGRLREAIQSERRVLLAVADADGTTSRHTLLPISMAAGTVRGLQDGRDGLAAFPLHRISAVALIDEADE